MRIRGSEIFIAIILVWIIPNIIFSQSASDISENTSNTEEFAAAVETTSISGPDGVKIQVLFDDGTVADLELEDYLVSVVLREMPGTFDIEAIKAQSVVARTYALRQHRLGVKHGHASVCTDAGCCQGYYDQLRFIADGGTDAVLNKVRTAVKETEDLVITFNDELIDATYFSCSGGKTEDAVAVWGTDIPYLRSIESPGEEIAVHYTDTLTIPVDLFLERLNLNKNLYPVIGQVTYTAGGGVDTVEISGISFKGTQIRTLLDLRSTAFVISVVGESVSITTKGFGHRVGMSQYGAEAMAQSGSNFEQILKHYYQGAELARI